MLAAGSVGRGSRCGAKDVMSSPSDPTFRDLLSSSADRVRAGCSTVELEEAPDDDVMGLDQHRGQITGEWIDTETGEVQRTRVAPADRAAVRKFLQRFRGREPEVGS